MPRPRKTNTDNWMPPGVRSDGYRYIIRSTLTGGKALRLCGKSATRAQVWAAYELLAAPDVRDTLDVLCGEYIKSPQYISLSPHTQRQYTSCRNTLNTITFNQGNRFMDLPPATITPGVLQQILDMRQAEANPVKGNREVKGFLSAVYAWALARDRVKLASNPCHAVKRNPETACTHYIHDWEMRLAQQHANRETKLFIELAYLLYARSQEVLRLTRKNLLDEGVFITRLKGSKSNIVEWSPRLRAAVDECKASTVLSTHLLTTTQGKRVTYAMLRKPWSRLMQTCATLNPEFKSFTPHDLKRKGMSDQDIIQNSAGHKTEAMHQQYKVKPDKVKPAK